MAEEAHKSSSVSGRIAISAAIAAAILANTAAIIIPIFLPVLAHTRGLTEAQGGLFAMAVYGGNGIGSMACALLPHVVERLNWRRTAAAGLILVIAASLALAMQWGFAGLFVLALVNGIGAGLVNAVLYAMCTEGDCARLIAAFQAAQIGFGAAIVWLVKPIVDRYGEAGAFLMLALLAAIALLLCPVLRARGIAQPPGEQSAIPGPDRISGVGWAAVIGLFVFFVASGASYGFLGYMGLAWGGTPAGVESAISGIMVCGMIGALLVMIVGSRFGYAWPLVISIGAGVIGLVLFIGFKPVAAFLPIGGLLYISLNTAPAYLFDFLTDVDRSTGAAMMMGASQLGGFAVGPAIAGYLVSPDYVRVNGFALALTIAASLIIYSTAWLHRRQKSETHINLPARVEG